MGQITISTAWAAVLGLLSGLLIIANVVDRIAGAVKKAKAPGVAQNEAQNTKLDAQDKRLAELEEWRKGVDWKLNKHVNSVEAIRDSDRVTQRALIALLDHGIDGNNIKQMQDAKKELQNLLIDK
jgi:hypothetical protein